MPRNEEISFRAGDVELAGTLTLPDGEGRHPWAVLVPSWLPRRRDGAFDRGGHPTWFDATTTSEPGILQRLSDFLVDRGVASLRYDPRGCGASPGSWAETDLFTRIDDARDAVGAMRSRPELDLRRTALVGHGEGAAIALSVAIGDPAVGAIGLVGAGARSWRDGLRRGVAERDRTGVDREHPIVAALDRSVEELIERVDRGESLMTIELPGETIGLALAGWEQAFHTPSLALATMLHRSVVLLHGADDAWSDADETRILARVLTEAGNEPIVQVADAAGHDLYGADASVRAFADALVERIQPRDLPPVLLAIEEMR
ncbi:MAG: alpha/beta hydrolase [Chloroflexi bacterium]|nr:alpha/beta hydrolase [Chloroflexota bacterium]